MDLNFYANEGSNLSKFVKYNIETINNRKYIVADSSTKKHSSGSPLIDLEEDFSINALVDLLNIGKSAVYEENNFIYRRNDMFCMLKWFRKIFV